MILKGQDSVDAAYRRHVAGDGRPSCNRQLEKTDFPLKLLDGNGWFWLNYLV
jgi:hypothetical protein